MPWTYPARLSIRVTQEMHDAYFKTAEELGIEVNDLVRQILEEGMKDLPTLRRSYSLAKMGDALEAFRVAVERAERITADIKGAYEEEAARVALQQQEEAS